jgi:hypothetical protein
MSSCLPPNFEDMDLSVDQALDEVVDILQQVNKFQLLAIVKRCFIFTHYYSHNVYSEKSKFKFRS